MWEGVASLRLSLPLSPPPCLLPPAGMGWLFSGVSQSLCFANRRQCSDRLIFSLSIPQFKRAPSDCSQGLRAGPHPKQCRPLLSVSPLFVGGRCGRLGYFSAGSCFYAGNVWALFNLSSQLGCPPRFENFPQTRQREGFLVIGNFLC